MNPIRHVVVVTKLVSENLLQIFIQQILRFVDVKKKNIEAHRL